MDQKFSEFSGFRESNKSLKHDWTKFLSYFCYLYLAGAVLASWSLLQIRIIFLKYYIFVNEFSEFSENI